ncbi:MAG TPA: hypothetical protein EYP67_04415 [Methanosarcinales archaeon]|nr:hypothetical protein [Methanosarcinales archaeon]
MIRDEEAQWIILAGFTISIALAVLIVLLNLSFMSGYQSSQAQIEFPMYELRELHDETYTEVNIIAMQDNITTDEVNDTMVNYGNLLSQLYAYHGQLVTTSVNTTTSTKNATTAADSAGELNVTTVTIEVTFYDGTTEYTERLSSSTI